MRDFYLAKKARSSNEFLQVFHRHSKSARVKSLNKSQTILTRLRNLDKAAILNMTAEIMDSKFYSSNYSNRISQLNLNWMLRSSISQPSKAIVSSCAYQSCVILHWELLSKGFMCRHLSTLGMSLLTTWQILEGHGDTHPENIKGARKKLINKD